MRISLSLVEVEVEVKVEVGWPVWVAILVPVVVVGDAVIGVMINFPGASRERVSYLNHL